MQSDLGKRVCTEGEELKIHMEMLHRKGGQSDGWAEEVD